MGLLFWVTAVLVLVVVSIAAAGARLDEIVEDEEDREW